MYSNVANVYIYSVPSHEVVPMPDWVLLLLKEVGGLAIIATVIRLLFQPFVDNYFFNATKRKEIEYKDWMCRSLFPDRIKRVDEGVVIALANRDSINAINQSILLHGNRLSNHDSELIQVKLLAEAVSRIEEGQRDMRDVMGETRDIVMGLRGPTDSPHNRRSTDKR